MKSLTHRIALLLIIVCPGWSPTLRAQDEVIYHVFQRSFYDSNGDRQGDLNGLRQKLGYLQELGVTAILMLPLYNSEFYHNYFATDFETIDPEFGTMDDYLALVREVHSRGMKIYMDMETQYVTSDHLWYKDSYGNPSSQYTNYLVYHGAGNTDPEPVIYGLTELNGFDGTVRKVTPVNLLNKDVLEYNERLFSHWADPNGDGKFDDGVDGFRLDHMMDDLDWKGTMTGLFEKFWSPLIQQVKAINPKLIFIAEQAQWASWGTDEIKQAGVDRIFAFNLRNAIASLDAKRIMRIADSTFAMVPNQNQAIVFIENHDIDRFASVVGQNPGKLKVGAALNLLIGGIPAIYYGQELGMIGKGEKFNNSDANDIPRREAFEWYQTIAGNGMALWYKDTGPWWDQTNLKDNDGISVQEERADPKSLWNTYRRLLALRHQHPALMFGKFHALYTSNPAVCTFLRETTGEHLAVLINVSGTAQEMDVEAGGTQQFSNATQVFGDGFADLKAGALHVKLPAYGVLIVLVKY